MNQPNLQTILLEWAYTEAAEGISDAEFTREAIDAIYAGLLAEVIGPDSPLNPTPDAIGQPGIDPKKWREWSIVENHLREQQVEALKRWCYGDTSNE